MRTRHVALLSAAALLVMAAPASGAKRYTNRTALNKVYPHGVGKRGAKDKTRGERVTTFRVNLAVYRANKGSDRDGDGIACEKA